MGIIDLYHFFSYAVHTLCNVHCTPLGCSVAMESNTGIFFNKFFLICRAFLTGIYLFILEFIWLEQGILYVQVNIVPRALINFILHCLVKL